VTSEEVAILIILYIFAVIIVILASKLYLARRYIRYLLLKNRSPINTVETPPIKPMIFDHKRLAPKALDAKVPISNPTTIPIPILYKILPFTKRIIGRLKHYVNQ